MDFNNYYQIYRLWVEDHYQIFEIIDGTLFLYFIIMMIYVFIFVFAARIGKQKKYPAAKSKNNILTIISTVENNESVFNSIDSIRRQDYDSDKFKIVVVANKCSQAYIDRLTQIDIIAIKTDNKDNNYSNDYKAAIEYCYKNKSKFDLVFLLKNGNLVDSELFTKINNAYYCGCIAMQALLKTENKDNTASDLEAISDEINDTIFRKGHTALGLSCALNGSGMAFDYQLFYEILPYLTDPNPQKQIEAVILKCNIYIEYLTDAVFYADAEKFKSNNYKKSIWLRIIDIKLFKEILSLPKYLLQRRLDYCDKVLQWMLPPRLLYAAMVIFIMCLVFMINWVLSIKWLFLLFLLMFVYILAVPVYLVGNRLVKAILLAPFIYLGAFFKRFSSAKPEK